MTKKIKSPLGYVYITLHASPYYPQRTIQFDTMAASGTTHGYTRPAMPVKIAGKRVGLIYHLERQPGADGFYQVAGRQPGFWVYNKYPARARVSAAMVKKFKAWALKYANDGQARAMDLMLLEEMQAAYDGKVTLFAMEARQRRAQLRELRLKIKQEARRLRK